MGEKHKRPGRVNKNVLRYGPKKPKIEIDNLLKKIETLVPPNSREEDDEEPA